MATPLKIDFVSDVVCPWCVVGLGGLEQALARLDGQVTADIHFQPFELNPDMAPEGEDCFEHIQKKYGSTREQSAKGRQMIREHAAAVGYTMSTEEGGRVWNTFDAHRLLHWAGVEGRQTQLKKALFEAYFTDLANVSDADVLVHAAEKAGLDGAKARDVLSSGAYADDVRNDERKWRLAGINAVPAVIINNRYLISGGQPPEAFEQALRNIAAEESAGTV
ncbi:MAG TPA: DsbA family oxidoreductase [Caulobacteraceae bacterium]|jgi:predicted DsbA family dithiol-disulfide isomerase